MKKFCTLALLPVLMIAAFVCVGSNYKPILDGAQNNTFSQGLEECQNLARIQPRYNLETLGAGLAAGLVGGLYAETDGGATLTEGLIVGGFAGLIGGFIDAGDHLKNIIDECMKGRKHSVVWLAPFPLWLSVFYHGNRNQTFSKKLSAMTQNQK